VIAKGSAALFWWGVSVPPGDAVLVAQEAGRTITTELTNTLFHEVMPVE
jgi:hypothetical protein